LRRLLGQCLQGTLLLLTRIIIFCFERLLLIRAFAVLAEFLERSTFLTDHNLLPDHFLASLIQKRLWLISIAFLQSPKVPEIKRPWETLKPPMAFAFDLDVYNGAGQTSPSFFSQHHQFILFKYNPAFTLIPL